MNCMYNLPKSSVCIPSLKPVPSNGHPKLAKIFFEIISE